MVFHEHENAFGLGFPQEVDVLGEEFRRGLGDEDVDAALDGVEGYGVVRRVGREDRDGIAGREGVDGGFVGFRVAGGGVGGEGGEGSVEIVVDVADVLLEVRADGWELAAGGADPGCC